MPAHSVSSSEVPRSSSDTPVPVEQRAPLVPEVYQGLGPDWLPFVRACVNIASEADKVLKDAHSSGPAAAKALSTDGRVVETPQDREYRRLAGGVRALRKHLTEGTILVVLAPSGQGRYPDRDSVIDVVRETISYVERGKVGYLLARLDRLQDEERQLAPQIGRYRNYSALGRVIADPEGADAFEVNACRAFLEAELAVVQRMQGEWTSSPEAKVWQSAHSAFQALHGPQKDAGPAIEMLNKEASITEQRILGNPPSKLPERIRLAKTGGDMYREAADLLVKGDTQNLQWIDHLLLEIQESRARRFSEGHDGWTPAKIEWHLERLNKLSTVLALGREATPAERAVALGMIGDIQSQPEFRDAIRVSAELRDCWYDLNRLNVTIAKLRDLMAGRY